MRPHRHVTGRRIVFAVMAAAFLLPAQSVFAPGIARGDEPQAPGGEALQQVRVWEEEDAFGRTWVKAEFLIAAPPVEVFAVLFDVERFPEFIPEVREARILEAGVGFQVVRFRAGSGMMESRHTLKRLFDQGEGWIAWSLVEGRPREVEGFWKISPAPEGAGSLVRYGTYVDPGFIVPDFIVRHYQRKTVPEMIANLNRRVLSGGRWRQQE